MAITMEELKRKAKAYDEAKYIMKEYLESGNAGVIAENTIKKAFPELAESEDERIRKDIIVLVEDWLDRVNKDNISTKEQMIAWLEKQKQDDLTNYKKTLSNYDEAEKEKCDFVGDGFIKCYADFQDFKEGETYWFEYIGDDKYNVRSDNLLGKTYHITPCQLYTIFKKQTWLEKQGNADNIEPKIEPKFHKGEWVVWQDKCYKVNFNGCGYELIDQNGLSTSLEYGTVDEDAHIFGIADAKDGDVLVDMHGNIGIFQECGDIFWYSYIYLGCDGKLRGFSIGGSHERTDTHPATHFQRDTLIKAMTDAGWEFDFEKKELRKIELQPSQWNISDFITWQHIVCDVLTKYWGIGQYLDDGFCKKIAQDMQEEWNKKLCLIQDSAWSEEDEIIYAELIKYFESLLNCLSTEERHNENRKWLNWLKSLKQRIGG